MVDLILQSLWSGLLTGGIYALVALGLALVFGTMKIINLAHGEMVLLAAYLSYTLEVWLGINPMLSILIAFPLICVVAAITYYLVSRIRVDRELNSLILTYGIGIILTNVILTTWTANVRSTGSDWLQSALVIGPLFSMYGELVSFLISVALMVALWWWVSRTWYGRAVRAVSSNRDAAKLMGINPHKTELVSFLVAGVLATAAGAAIFSTRAIDPSVGGSLTLTAFIITVLAGMGSIPGALIGGILLGITEALTVTLYNSAVQHLADMVLFLVVLYVLPNGLFGSARRRG